MPEEPENLVLELLRGIRSEIRGIHSEIDGMRVETAGIRAEMVNKAELRSELNSLRADVASDLLVMQSRNDREFRDVRDQISGVRQAVVEYHSAVIGHGVLISELEARMRRVEQHPNLSSSDAH